MRPILSRLDALLNTFADVGRCPLLPEDKRVLLCELSNISPREVGAENIGKIIATCEALRDFRAHLLAEMPPVSIVDPFTGERNDVSPVDVYEIGRAAHKTEEALQEKLGAHYAGAKLAASLNNAYIQTPAQLSADLMGVRNIFSGYVLVLVHRAKGFYLMENAETKLEFNRITQGYPRFKVGVMERLPASPRGGRRSHTAPHSPADGTCLKSTLRM
jgi:hypothetical protein